MNARPRLPEVIALLVLGSALVAACGAPAGSPGTSPSPRVTPASSPTGARTPAPTAVPNPTAAPPSIRPGREQALAELDANRAKWDATRPASYRYTWGNGCFCPQEYTGPFRVTVRVDMVLVEPTEAGGGAQPSSSVRPRIEDVFAAARSALASADDVKIAYDPTFGFPTRVAVDAIKQAVDDEFTITVTDFSTL